MKFFDYGVPKASWSGAFGAAGVCVSGALFFLSLHCPPHTAMAALGHSQHKSGAAFISESRTGLALCLVVMWLLTVVGVWEVL